MHKSVNKSARTHFMIQGHVFLQVVNDAIHEGKNALLYSKDWIKINFILHKIVFLSYSNGTNETVLVSEHNAFSRTARLQCKVEDV